MWPEDALYVFARRPGRTWNNATSEPRVSIAIDVGRNWVEVASIVVHGRAEPLAPDHPSMRTPISAWHEKYRSLLTGEGFARFTEEIRVMGFLRVPPERVLTWDHARA